MNVAIPTLIDPRLALLARASAWHDLFQRDEMDLDHAWHELVNCVVTLVPMFRECDVCGRSPCRTESFCDSCRVADCNTPQPAQVKWRVPNVTVEAVKHCVRERGADALREPDNLQRLSMFDQQSIVELDAWLHERGYSR